jgi:flagellar biosynthesis anti-sigma factor FlgM
MMEVIHKGHSGTEPSQLMQNSKAAAGQAGCDRRTEVSRPIVSAKVNISKKAREPQRITEPLARKGDELLAEKVRQVKEIIAKGEYEVDPREVAKSIIRTEISRHLEKSKVQSMNIDLTELLALTEEEIASRKKWRRNVEEQKKAVAAWDVVVLSQQIDIEPSLAPSTPSRRISC